MTDKLSHIDDHGNASMVDVSSKQTVRRTAVACGFFVANSGTLDAIMDGQLPKGEALSVARIAGIQAAKSCGMLIPLCHPLPLEFAAVDFERVASTRLQITATAIITGKTGIEMEALTAVTVAALTIWDMTKAIDKDLKIEGIALLSKKKEEI
jgi:cyclic pyranopterin phosphate synthase